MNQNDELMHYGVLGMKWGVHRALRYNSRTPLLARRAYGYDKKSSSYSKKAEKIHAKQDLGAVNSTAVRSSRLAKKAAGINKKAVNQSNSLKKAAMERRAAKLNYRSEKLNRKAESISKTAGYGKTARKYVSKSNKMSTKAAKVRLKMASDRRYIERTKQKVNSLSDDDIRRGKDYVKRFLEI